MTKRSDDEICAEVRDAIENAQVDALAITVTIADGVVELSGEVGSHSERLEAMQTARSVAAPARVRSALTVAPMGRHFRMRDDQIATEVASALLGCGIPPESIAFHVEDHVVTLTGTARDAKDRARIRHIVQNAPGVDFIDNRMEIRRQLSHPAIESHP